ncbi:hypothetical protein SDC9_152842 [bioreactor metagenome]|uniref:Uncharacterized protein n=1 Tax=bioreactor metagenome TaxID=1076179 RepID=A0A645EU88_9ZZZZ
MNVGPWAGIAKAGRIGWRERIGERVIAQRGSGWLEIERLVVQGVLNVNQGYLCPDEQIRTTVKQVGRGTSALCSRFIEGKETDKLASDKLGSQGADAGLPTVPITAGRTVGGIRGHVGEGFDVVGRRGVVGVVNACNVCLGLSAVIDPDDDVVLDAARCGVNRVRAGVGGAAVQ